MNGTWTVAEYEYDGAKRAGVKEVYASGVLNETRHFYYTEPSKWQVVEERVGTSSDAERQFVWGVRFVDDLVGRDRDTTGDRMLNERLYGLQDANWNLTSATSSSGHVEERYMYSAYGLSTILDGSFTLRMSSSYEWEVRFAGHRHDLVTQLSSVRRRVYSPRTGWLQRDGAGYLMGINLYEYVGSQPLSVVDAFGLGFDPIGVLKRSLCGLGNNVRLGCACCVIGLIELIPLGGGIGAIIDAVDCVGCGGLSIVSEICSNTVDIGLLGLILGAAMDCLLSFASQAAQGGVIIAIGSAGGPVGIAIAVIVLLLVELLEAAVFLIQNGSMDCNCLQLCKCAKESGNPWVDCEEWCDCKA